MFDVSQSPASSESEGNKGATEARDVFRFKPRQVAEAISFHLLEEGKARRVNADSLRRTVGRITAELVVPKADWAAMSNGQRLRWLLDASHTTVQTGTDGTALLAAGK